MLRHLAGSIFSAAEIDPLEAPRSVLRILNRHGDSAVAEWRPGVKTEEHTAKTEFDKLQKQGYLLFEVPAPGKTPEQVRKFNPLAYEIVATPQLRGG